MGLGARIRQLRQSRGLTQEQLAGRELTKSFISLVEREKASPSVETLGLLARRLGTSVDALLGAQDRLPEQVATGLLSLSAEALRKRNAPHAKDLLNAVTILTRTYRMEEVDRELVLQWAQVALEDRDFNAAAALATEAKRRAEEARDLWRTGRALLVLGTAALRRRDIPAALQHLHAALEVLRRAKASRDPARVEALIHLASALVYAGDYPRAIQRYSEAARAQVARQQPILRARALWGLGAAYRHQGDTSSAHEVLSAARDLFEQSEELTDLAHVLHNLGQVAAEQGHYKDALRHFHHALRVAERMKMLVLRANVLTEIARVHVALGSLDDAAAFAAQALSQARAVDDPVEVAEVHVVLARIAFARGHDADASRLLKTAAEIFTARGMPNRVAELAREAGMALLAR
ncbi:MAG: helix-turn-helix transcriptional regulator [Armatimonadota bacterium]|nr:helix-turn-helix transcriptional regulator [Armatimonadota bacterium]MDR7450790.1 helix-turn-helix transcriptional regulator [Armatimonadota bacterium]MDR7466146.1 helix-turn-helix transcriptional regulator [Armatimonadota bacterium]MDR7493817.1 helix-turn-helix transcriptional regulator [Armatimonadota bacterium]MDR7499022.1 helix-turn-helix transcriptional regulator [Armatimonadota bacterium]